MEALARSARRGHGGPGHLRHHHRPAPGARRRRLRDRHHLHRRLRARWRSTSTSRPGTGSASRWATRVGPGGINRSLRNIPVLVGVGEDMGKMLSRTPGCSTSPIPMTCSDPGRLPGDRRSRPSVCATRSGTGRMDLAIALGKPARGGRGPRWPASTTSPWSPRSTSTGRTASHVLAEMVDEAGGLAALAPHPGRPEAEDFSRLDFVQRHTLKLTLLETWGALPAAGDRHIAEFVPVGADRGVGLGGATSTSSSPPWPTPPGAPGRLHRRRRRLAGRHQGAPDLAVG